jgi:hypothetical protein
MPGAAPRQVSLIDTSGLERASRNRNDLDAKIAEAVRAGYGVPVEE